MRIGVRSLIATTVFIGCAPVLNSALMTYESAAEEVTIKVKHPYYSLFDPSRWHGSVEICRRNSDYESGEECHNFYDGHLRTVDRFPDADRRRDSVGLPPHLGLLLRYSFGSVHESQSIGFVSQRYPILFLSYVNPRRHPSVTTLTSKS